MASSSSFTDYTYDVFLSFNGEDTRNSFTDHLYYRLKQEGITAFRDNESINKGQELQPEFTKAIKQSKASIIVLSQNYATSTWCLDELLLILEQRRECDHFVLPVFYGVDPTDVRKLKGKFDIKVKPYSKWTDNNVDKWKRALVQVADLAGLVISGPETIFLKEIVDTIYNKVDRKEVSLPNNLVGMASHDEQIDSWLKKRNLEFLVIHGMGGSGKTTLAKHIYCSKWRNFEYASLLEDIGDTCKGSNGLRGLQQQLLYDISGGKQRTIPGASQGTPLIEDVLKRNRALIVLNDIVEGKQLLDLLGSGEINADSKIIITTSEDTEKWFDCKYWRYQKYKMKLLNDVESSQLLCLHAFKLKTPMTGFEEFVLQVVQYCGGNPLALAVLGSSFYNNNTVEYWKSRLDLLEKDMNKKIQHVLQASYNSLPYTSEQKLFLHIACFFVGKDMDYAVKILEPDYSAVSGIKTLTNMCLVSVSPNKKIKMHRLLQEMGKNIVRQEADLPVNRSRVWLSKDSRKILRKKKGSETVEGLALDMKMLAEEDISPQSLNLRTDALNNMDSLKLLQLNFVELSGSYDNFSEDLRWLCWVGFYLRTIPPNLNMRKLVAIDMSYSKLEVFEPPTVLRSLRILNLKDSHNLTEIRNISNIPYLETLILWNCYNLVNVCDTLGGLKGLALLNMTGCNTIVDLKKPTFPFPSSLHRLFLKDCHLVSTDSFPLSFSVQLDLQYLNLANSLFESLPSYNHLEKLRVLDLSFCSRLEYLRFLPSTLAELYIYGCELLERITFQSRRFTLQEFGYLGCIHLYEVEGFFKLVPISKLDETDLGHMTWLHQYQLHEVCLVGDDEVTVGRSWHIQMLYEFDIMSTSLLDIKDPNMTSEYMSKSSSLSFEVPLCPKNKRLKGIDVTFKYAISGDECAWFCKISMANGVDDLMYNPKVFGKPEIGEVCIWLSYWPIGHKMKSGDKVNVSIVVLSGLEVHECGVSLVYSDIETFESKTECVEILGGDLSLFRLSTGAYYLCRRDFFELTEVGRLTSDWFRILAGDTIDYTELRGWRKTGRPEQVNPSFTEVKTIRCIIHGPQLEEMYNMAEMSKSSVRDKNVAFTSSLLEEGMKSGTKSELIDETMEKQKEGEGMSKAFASDEIKESDSPPRGRKLKSVIEYKLGGAQERKAALKIKEVHDQRPAPSNEIFSTANSDFELPNSKREYTPNQNLRSSNLRIFSLADLNKATSNFDVSSKIGEGGFGSVHMGTVKRLEPPFDEIRVAVKQGKFQRGYRLWEMELKILGEITHQNLVKLIGYCYDQIGDKSNWLLVYEYMPNGSVDDHLSAKSLTPLSWDTRLNIALGAAIGLTYLHEGMARQIIFREFKPSNILLDEDWNAKLSDFGFAIEYPQYGRTHITTLVVGTQGRGYPAPEYVQSGRLTLKSNVWSYGIFLEELITGRLPFNQKNSEISPGCMGLVCCYAGAGKSKLIVDPRLVGTYSDKSMQKIRSIAAKCLVKDPRKRPKMSEVVQMLRDAIALQNQQSGRS